MLRAMVRSAPVTPRTPHKPPLVALINENLICSEVTNAESSKRTPKRDGAVALDLFPTEKLVSVLYGFAKALWLDSERRVFLKAKFLAKLQRQKDSSSILKSEHTLLTYVNWAIRHVEKAACSVMKETREGQLEIAEQMLKALTSMDTQGYNANVPNSYIVGLTHLYLALVWALRKQPKSVAAHLLEMFVVCPKYARHNFAPELWERLFRPYLTGIQTWYKREHNNITNPSRSSLSRAAHESSPFAVRAHTPRLTELRSKNSKQNASPTMEKKALTDSNRSDKLLQVNLLHDLYEETLDESTQQYAQHYQELVICNEGRDQCGQIRSSKLSRAGVPDLMSPEEQRSPFRSGMKTRADMSERRRSISEGYSEEKPMQVRRSLYEAIFGTQAEDIQERSQLNCICSSDQVLDHKALLGEPSYTALKKTRKKSFQNSPPPTIMEEWDLESSDNLVSTFQKRCSSVKSSHVLDNAASNKERLRMGMEMGMTPKAHYYRSIQRPAADSKRLIDLFKDSESQMTLPWQCSYIRAKNSCSSYGEHRRPRAKQMMSREEQFVDAVRARAGTSRSVSKVSRRSSFGN